MTLFKLPELATEYGQLADAAFGDGSPGSAHVMRELGRNGNLLKARGGQVQRFVSDARSSSDGQGNALSFAPPYWQHLVPGLIIPANKKSGITSVRCRLRVQIDNGYKVLFSLGTMPRPTPRGRALSTAELVVATGTGAEQVLTFTQRAQTAPGESLSLYCRHLVDPDNDAKLVTGTYGTPNTGTVVSVPTPYSFTASGATWNNVHTGGHYVIFEASGGRVLHVPSKIVDTLSTIELAIFPHFGTDTIRYGVRASTFTLYKSPAVRLISCAVYGVDGSP